MHLFCLAIISEVVLDKENKIPMGKKRMGECGLTMHETEPYLYICANEHKRYYPFNKHDLRSKIHSHTKDQDAYY